MKHRISIPDRVTHPTLPSTLVWGLALAMAMGTATRAVGQGCDPCPYPPLFAPSGDPVWDFALALPGGDEGRIAVVVKDTLYDSVSSAIVTYANDLDAEGHPVVVYKFNGDGEFLRDRLMWLYEVNPEDPETLSGAVLVGGQLPYVVYEVDTEGWPADAFFMDMDGTWHQAEPGVYDSWDEPQDIEIWVSRIKADNLPLLGAEEYQIINRYFERNTAHRRNAFAPTHKALVYAQDNDDWVDAWPRQVTALGNAFADVEGVGVGTTKADYLQRLGYPPPENYRYIVEIGHGSPWGHELDEMVYGADYLDKDPQVIGFSLMNCNTCSFIDDDYLGGIVTFNRYEQYEVSELEVSTLVAVGWVAKGGPADEQLLWRAVGTGSCIGEGFKAAFNASPNVGRVLLGDGSLKADSHHWDGDDFFDFWSTPSNWDPDGEPDLEDHVRIGAAATTAVLMDADFLGGPELAWSVALRDGADLTLLSDHGLQLSGSLLAERQAGCTVTMQPRSSLELPGSVADISHATVIMEADASNTTSLFVGGTIVDCAAQVGQGCDVHSDSIDQSVFSSVEGIVHVEGTIFDSEFVVAPNGVVTADVILGSEFDVGSNALVTADGIWSCAFNPVEGTVNVTATIFNSEFVVAQDGVATANSINSCMLYMSPDSYVQTATGIVGGPIGDQSWTIDHATVEAEGISTLWGDWTLTGGSATFEQMSATEEYGIQMLLQDGALVQIEDMSFQCPTFPGHGPYYAEHELVYGVGANQFGGGGGVAPPWQGMQVGSHTVIRPADGVTEPHLDLDLSCELYIESDFRNDVVYDNWNTLAVDIIAHLIWSEDPAYWFQTIELISPDFAGWYQGNPLAFMDAPCHGGFGDLVIPEEEWPGHGPSERSGVFASNWWDNSVIDTGPRSAWRPRERDDGGPPEAGFFDNVTIGDGRTLIFAETNGVIYYTGTAVYDDATILYWPWDASEPMVVTVHTDPAIDDLIIPAVRTIYGDWDGDCALSNVELADLEAAIKGGDDTYDPLMDYDCDGRLTTVVEVVAFLANAAKQPPCGSRGGGGDDDESRGEPYERYDDVPALAAWLIEVLGEEQIEEIAADLAAAAVEFAEVPVGEDLAELVFWLE